MPAIALTVTQCEEGNPCTNCSRREMECTFDRRSSLTPTDKPNEAVILFDLRNRMPASESNFHAQQPGDAIDPFRFFSERIERGAFYPQEWTRQYFQLTHHYTLYTCKTIARRPNIRQAWREAIPKIAYSYEFLMHGILVFSALHLAYLKPERHSYYLACSGFHKSFGLRSFRRILLSPTDDNFCALFAFCSFIMVYISASPTDPTEPNPGDGLDSIIELFSLCRGNLVLVPYLKLIQGSSLQPLFLPEFHADLSSAKRFGHQFEGLEEHLVNLHQLIQSNISDLVLTECFHKALDRLKASFETIRCFEPPLEIGLLYIWPLSMGESFIQLRQRQPVALIFLATYSVQLHAFADYWFVGRQGTAWLSKFSAVLPTRFHEWLRWPTLYSSQDPVS